MPDSSAAKPPEKSAWVSAIERIALKSLATGNFAWFVLLAVTLAAIWRLDAAGLKEVLLQAIGTLGWLGYPVSGITIYISVRTLRWREAFYLAEMTRMAAVRNEAIQKSLQLPLSTSQHNESRPCAP
jgi:hypothetical protein